MLCSSAGRLQLPDKVTNPSLAPRFNINPNPNPTYPTNPNAKTWF